MKIVILTGAGISAESGLGTFRDAGGIWSKYDLADVATSEGFARNPGAVHDFYNARRRNAAEANPNAAHQALARLELEWDGEVVLVTQNVDDLHARAGSQALQMHGALNRARCGVCETRWPAPMEMSTGTTCPACGANAARPDVVWFGEMPVLMDEIAGHLATADLFVAIGTSGQVYPAAGFVEEAREAGADTLEINLEPSDVSSRFHSCRIGPASVEVPSWVDEIIGASTQ